MTKPEAIFVINRAGNPYRKTTQTELNRVVRALKTLGLDAAERRESLQRLEYIDECAKPYGGLLLKDTWA